MGPAESIPMVPEGCGKTKQEALEALEHHIMFRYNSQIQRSSNGRPYIVTGGGNLWVKYQSKQVEYHNEKIIIWRAYVNYE
jgi:uridylate kinase